jgi:hypothetical protein
MTKHAGRNAWMGLLHADADSEDALRHDAQLGLEAWAETGRLELKRSEVRK